MGSVTITGGTGQYAPSFTDNTPSPRYGAGVGAWTLLKAEESAARDGIYTQVGATATLSPADSDPTAPQAWDVTIRGATLAAGWYKLTFLDAAGNQQPLRPVYSGAGIAPSVEDIARRVRSRLADAGGQPLTTFSAATRPTRDDVEGFIRSGVRAVRLKVGAVQDELAEDAREVVELYAAAQVELQSWPEQTANSASPYSVLMSEYADTLKDLEKSSQEIGEGREAGAAGDVGMPRASFPCPDLDYTAGW